MQTEIKKTSHLNSALSGQDLSVALAVVKSNPKMFSHSAMVLHQTEDISAFIHPAIGALSFQGVSLIAPSPRIGENRIESLEDLRISQAAVSLPAETLYLMHSTLTKLCVNGRLYGSVSPNSNI